MSLSSILYTGQRAISANQTAIQVAGQNISNVNTPGYSRQRAELTTLQSTANDPFLAGGVDVTQVSRAYDKFVTGQVQDASSRLHNALAQADLFGQIESVFNDLDVENAGLSRALEDFFNGFDSLAGDPESLPLRTTVLESGETLASVLRQYSRNLTGLHEKIETALEDELAEVNGIAADIVELNRRMTDSSGSQAIPASAARDQRDLLVKQLSEKIGVTAFETDNGDMTVLFKGGGFLVSDTEATRLIAEPDPNDPTRFALFTEDTHGHQTGLRPLLGGGKMNGLLEVNNEVIPRLMASLDQLAAYLTQSVNQVHSEGFGLDGSTGLDFFTPSQVSGQALFENTGGGRLQSLTVFDDGLVALDDLQITFGAGVPPQFDVVNAATGEVLAAGQTYTAGESIVVSGLEAIITDSGVLPQSGDTFLIRTTRGAAQGMTLNPGLSDNAQQVAASQGGGRGDNSNALALAQIAEGKQLNGDTLGVFYRTLITTIGADSQRSANQVERYQLFLTEAETRREAVSGVSLEEEQIDLIRFQQAFAAAAQLVSVADEMAQTVLDLAR